MPVADKFTEMLPGARLYGLTEVSGRLCVLPPSELGTRVGSVGVPIGAMTVVGRRPDGELAAPGRARRALRRRAAAHAGLSRRTGELSAAALTAHGFKTGDFGRVDADGYVGPVRTTHQARRRESEHHPGAASLRLNLGLFHDVAVLAAADELLVIEIAWTRGDIGKLQVSSACASRTSGSGKTAGCTSMP